MKVEIKQGDPGVGENVTILFGGDPTRPNWEGYLDGFVDEFHPRLVAIRAVVESAGLVGRLASNFCNGHYFQFEDGRVVAFTWRAWGDLMQAIVGKNEGYMRYYM
jgi:hypothetical protein